MKIKVLKLGESAKEVDVAEGATVEHVKYDGPLEHTPPMAAEASSGTALYLFLFA